MKIDRDSLKIDLIMKMIAACDLSCSQREVKLLTDSECLELLDLLDVYLDRVTAARVGPGEYNLAPSGPAYLE